MPEVLRSLVRGAVLRLEPILEERVQVAASSALQGAIRRYLGVELQTEGSDESRLIDGPGALMVEGAVAGAGPGYSELRGSGASLRATGPSMRAGDEDVPESIHRPSVDGGASIHCAQPELKSGA